MGNTITTIYRMNGSRNFLAVIQITGDGTGNETDTTVIDPAALTGAPSTFKIKSINWSLNDFSAALKWEATAPVLAASLSQYSDDIEFFATGAPLVNNAGAGITGHLTLDTFGMTAASRGTIVINGYH